ncbi:3'-5' exoribonuclease HELZ2-like [Glandiceps talaboti]
MVSGNLYSSWTIISTFRSEHCKNEEERRAARARPKQKNVTPRETSAIKINIPADGKICDNLPTTEDDTSTGGASSASIGVKENSSLNGESKERIYRKRCEYKQLQVVNGPPLKSTPERITDILGKASPRKTKSTTNGHPPHESTNSIKRINGRRGVHSVKGRQTSPKKHSDEYNSDEDEPPDNPYTDEEFDAFENEDALIKELPRNELERLLRESPDIYKLCTLECRMQDKDKAIPCCEDLDFDIRIPTKLDRGRALNLDNVVIELLEDDADEREIALDDLNGKNNPFRYGKVAGIIRRAEEPWMKKVACTLDEYSDNLMVPINGNFPKMMWLKGKGWKKSDDNYVCIPMYRVSNKPGHTFILKMMVEISNDERQHIVFLTRFLNWDVNKRYPLCIVVDVLQGVEDLTSGLKYLRAKYGVKDTFNGALEKPVVQSVPTTHEYEDCRNLLTFTIDPPESQDLDDAISIEELDNGNYRVGVHIADVASRVPQDSELDRAAFKRGTSYYPPDGKPIYMLPSWLSTETCSLLQNKDRRALSFFFELDINMNVVHQHTEVKRTLIKSKHRLSYEEVQGVISEDSTPKTELSKELEKKLRILHKLAQDRRRHRLGKAYFLAQPCNYGGDTDKATEAHHLVEEMMVLANENVAEWLLLRFPDCTPLRRQCKPREEEMEWFLRQFGQFLRCSVNMSAKLISNENGPGRQSSGNIRILSSLLDKLVSDRECSDQEMLRQLVCDDNNHPELFIMLMNYYKIQERAEYTCSDPQKQSEHFGLKTNGYVRCTSPIRRYIDLVIQRFVIAGIQNAQAPYDKDEVSRLCSMCNQTEDKQRCFAQDCKKLSLALKLQQNPVKAYAVVEKANEKALNFQIMHMTKLSADDRKLTLSMLKVCDKPHEDLEKQQLKLKWSEHMYDCQVDVSDFTLVGAQRKVLSLNKDQYCVTITSRKWEKVTSTVLYCREKNTQKSFQDLDELKTKLPMTKPQRITSEVQDNKRNRIDPCQFERSFGLGDTLQIQLGMKFRKGFMTPGIDLLQVAEGFDICCIHRRDPIHCFSEVAEDKVPSLSSRKEWEVGEYQQTWLPLLSMSSADAAVRHYDNYSIKNVDIEWSSQGSGIEGRFTLTRGFCDSRDIKIYAKTQYGDDYVCVRYQQSSDETVATTSNWRDNLFVDQTFRWIGHCVVTKVDERGHNKTCGDENMVIHVRLKDNKEFLRQRLRSQIHCTKGCVVEIVQKSIPYRRMEEAVLNLDDASELVVDTCLGRMDSNSVVREQSVRQILLSVVSKRGDGLPSLNPDQASAIKKALEQKITVIQGPPGTGKSYTAANLGNAFVKTNKRDGKNDGRVLHCAPSNKAVDVAADYLKRFDLKIIRMYSKNIEAKDFPLPGWRGNLHSRPRHSVESNPAHGNIALHHLIRTSASYGKRITDMEKQFRKNGGSISRSDYKAYRGLIFKAEKAILGNCDVILCTCSEAASKRLAGINISQCIIDEAGMCTEPETLVPLVRSNPKQIVLIGDHRQLQPIVPHNLSKQLGLAISLLERYCFEKRFEMLKIQYRMHPCICNFPSKQFYDNELQTDDRVRSRRTIPKLNSIWPGGPQHPVVFCHSVGREETLTVSTEEGSEQSKKNMQEIQDVVRILTSLTSDYGIYGSHIQVLSQYQAQCSQIKKELKSKVRLKDIDVSSVIGSQGSEKDYVVLSTVRSLPRREIEESPTKGWLNKNLGFVTDDHQINVAITRARRGLIIVGNKNLLRTDKTWRKLLQDYERQKCVVYAREFLPTRAHQYRR